MPKFDNLPPRSDPKLRPKEAWTLGPGAVSDLPNPEGGAARHIEEIRIRLKLTQVELADRMGVSRSTYQNFVAGRSSISLAAIERFIYDFGVDLSELFHGKPGAISSEAFYSASRFGVEAYRYLTKFENFSDEEMAMFLDAYTATGTTELRFSEGRARPIVNMILAVRYAKTLGQRSK